jgi:hypothetical protein
VKVKYRKMKTGSHTPTTTELKTQSSAWKKGPDHEYRTATEANQSRSTTIGFKLGGSPPANFTFLRLISLSSG